MQVYPELCVWQQMSAELMRQTHLECSQRGVLLQAAMERQQQLLQQALDSCDMLYQAMLASAATQRQQHQAMQHAQTDTQSLQQENARLKVSLPLLVTCLVVRVTWRCPSLSEWQLRHATGAHGRTLDWW